MTRDGTATRERILESATGLVLERGFAGTSLDDILGAAGVTKGAFFHHFRSKAELGTALVERYARADLLALESLWGQADRLSRDPLQRVLLFLGLFAESIDALAGENPGCLYVSFVYERQLGDESARDTIESTVLTWRRHLRERLDEVAEHYPPRIPVDLDAVADLVFTTNEGAYVLARATGQPKLLRDQLLQVRNYVELLFSPLVPTAA
jgi:TetR/AcrR family transcriptional regulator, transcriptional repressor for nem operon